MPRSARFIARSPLLGGLLAAALLSGCGHWVKLTPGGEAVRVADLDQVGECRRRGETTSYTREKIGGVGRSVGAVAEEMQYLARNTAADMGGDTIVPLGPIHEGKQRFAIYRCGPIKQ